MGNFEEHVDASIVEFREGGVNILSAADKVEVEGVFELTEEEWKAFRQDLMDAYDRYQLNWWVKGRSDDW